jgi:hypothetical protein
VKQIYVPSVYLCNQVGKRSSEANLPKVAKAFIKATQQAFDWELVALDTIPSMFSKFSVHI